VQFTGVLPNRSEDPRVWIAMSPNEIRAQLALRGIPRQLYAHLNKEGLLGYIAHLIETGHWAVL
jgi:hypothetical protein